MRNAIGFQVLSPGPPVKKATVRGIMNSQTLLRMSGVAAMIGGLLRVLSALPLPLEQIAQETILIVVDVLIRH